MTRRKCLDVAVVVIPFALGVRLAGGQETENGGVTSGAVIRFLWLEPQGLKSTPYPPGSTGVGTPDLKLGRVPAGGRFLWLGVFVSNWGPQGELASWFGQLLKLSSSRPPVGIP